jgi:hypothetical protein
MNLYYKVKRDVPLLFVPFQEPNATIRKKTPEEYSGSHLVEGVKNWREKGYKPINPEYFADEFAERLRELGFPGYISCDECEIFLTHESMRKSNIGRPFKIDVDLKTAYNKKFADTITKAIEVVPYILCEDNDNCPLYITEGSRDNMVLTFTRVSIEEASGFDFSKFLREYDEEYKE